MRIFINRIPVSGPWGGGNLFLKAFCKHFAERGHEIVFQLDSNVDAIFMEEQVYQLKRL